MEKNKRVGEQRNGGEEEEQEQEGGGGDWNGLKYLIVNPDKCGFRDLFRFVFWFDASRVTGFIETESSEGGEDEGGEDQLGPINGDHRLVIIISIILRKIIGVVGKPMEWVGYLVEFILNLLSLNGGNPLSLFFNLIKGKAVMPQRNSDTFISAIGHLDGRVDLYRGDFANVVAEVIRNYNGNEKDVQSGNRILMDLCMMASKLSYENEKVVKNIVNHHWKMHFVEFYNGWNDFQQDMSTQVFILCDKPKDANIILISFRGTEPFDADDWSTDFDYSWYEIPKLGKVHMGFLEALGLGNRTQASTFQHHLLGTCNLRQSNVSASDESEEETGDKKKLLPEMVEMTAYYAVRSKLKELLEEHKNAKFIVTGHSLGGALAILFPTVLLLHEEKEMMQRLLAVYTFGQPRVGDRQLGNFMRSHLVEPTPKYFRVVYSNDLVPRLPYDDKTFLYKHFGPCLYYDSNYIEQNVDEEPNPNYFAIRYLIPEYMNAVWELLRSLTMGDTYGPEYKEGWFSIFLRVVGLAMPGISAHSPTDYVNSVRLGREHAEDRTM